MFATLGKILLIKGCMYAAYCTQQHSANWGRVWPTCAFCYVHYSGGSEFTLKKHDINKVSPSVKYPVEYHTKIAKNKTQKLLILKENVGQMIRVSHSLYTLPVICCFDWKHAKSWSRRDLDCWPLRKYVSDLSINNVQKRTVQKSSVSRLNLYVIQFFIHANGLRVHCDPHWM